MKRKFLFLFLLLLAGCATSNKLFNNSIGNKSQINEDNLRANLEFLASDALEGREATKRGEELASLYIASQLKQYGVLPLNGSATYFQQVSMERVFYEPQSKLALIDEENRTISELQYNSEYIGLSWNFADLDTMTELVFVGYGITAEEYDYDDYRNVEVKRKIVLIYPGEPPSNDSSYFDGPDESDYASTRKKIATARQNGAAGILLQSSREKEWGWERIVSLLGEGRLQLAEPDKMTGEQPVRGTPVMYLNENSMAKLLTQGLVPRDTLENRIAAGKSLPHFEFASQIEVQWNLTKESINSARNVIGIVEGNDEQLKNEFVAITAHYDHEGVAEEGIYNGADDDGSGTVAVLELARIFARTRLNHRTLLFIFHTAEEKGLLGSKYLASDTTLTNRIVGLINLDMIGRGATDSIHCIGTDKLSTELYSLVEEINKAGKELILDYRFNDPADPERLYFRSDHYNYAKRGIPVTFFFDNMKEDYHRMTDDVEKINFRKISRVARLSFDIALEIANLDHRLRIDKALVQ